MKVAFEKAYLKQLYYGEPQAKVKLAKPVIKQYVKVVNRIIRAKDFQELKAIKSLHIEKLHGEKAGISSARINKQYRLEFWHDKENVTIRLIKLSKHYE